MLSSWFIVTIPAALVSDSYILHNEAVFLQTIPTTDFDLGTYIWGVRTKVG